MTPQGPRASVGQRWRWPRTPTISSHWGYAHAGLAAVLAAAGDSHGAAAETSAALSAYRAKGDVVSAPMLDVSHGRQVETSAETLLQGG